MPVLGLCVGMQLLFESSTELGGAEGIGLLGGQVQALEADGLKVPQIGWNPVSWQRPSELDRRPARPVPLLPRALVRPAAAERRRGGHRHLRRRVRQRGGAAAGVRGAVPPREVGARRAGAASATSRACAPHDPPARGGHPRRARGAPAAGRLRARDRVRRGPGRGRARLRRGRRPGAARGRPRRRARRRAGQPRATPSGSCASSGCRCSTGAGCGRCTRSTGRFGRGRRAGDPRDGCADRRRTSSSRRWRTSATRSPSASTCGRAGSR